MILETRARSNGPNWARVDFTLTSGRCKLSSSLMMDFQAGQVPVVDDVTDWAVLTVGGREYELIKAIARRDDGRYFARPGVPFWDAANWAAAMLTIAGHHGHLDTVRAAVREAAQ